jgi:hypothetical protein
MTENEIYALRRNVSATVSKELNLKGSKAWEFEFCTTHFGLFTHSLESHHELNVRPKLREAFQTLLEKAEDDLRKLPAITIHIQQKGETGITIFPEGEPIILFPNNLDRVTQSTVDYTVAHEFAHVLTNDAAIRAMECECGKGDSCDCIECECLGCKNFDNFGCNYLLDPSEQLADALVAKWGYQVPAAKARAREKALREESLPKLSLDIQGRTERTPASA